MWKDTRKPTRRENRSRDRWLGGRTARLPGIRPFACPVDPEAGIKFGPATTLEDEVNKDDLLLLIAIVAFGLMVLGWAVFLFVPCEMFPGGCR